MSKAHYLQKQISYTEKKLKNSEHDERYRKQKNREKNVGSKKMERNQHRKNAEIKQWE